MLRSSRDVASQSAVIRAFWNWRRLRRLPRWAGLAFAVLGVGVSAAIRENVAGHLHEGPYLLFFPPIILSSVFFGRGTGFVAAALSVLVLLWLIPPEASFAISKAHALALVLFAVVASICAGSIELLQLSVAMTLDREERLKAACASEERKSTMLSEAVHRIRNDLSAVSSLLTLQSRRRPEASDALAAAATQLRVIGRLHSRFTESGGAQTVFSDDFLRELVLDWEATHLAGGSIRLVLRADRTELALGAARTLGLIANELVTNAAKYAFPGGQGTVEIAFRHDGDHDTLTVADDGVGLSADVQGTGLGTKLLHRLAAQVGGEFRRERRQAHAGTIGIVTLPARRATPARTDHAA